MNAQNQDNRLFLLDAYALIFRGYYAFIKNPRVNSKGLNTSAIMGFMNSLLEVIKKEKPTHLAVVFDVGKATVRTDYFPEYKANRDETPEAIRLAVPYIQQILTAMHIPILYAEGYEADDVIGTFAHKAKKEGFTTLMMTPDKDFAQLVDENIMVYKPASRGGGIEIWNVEKVQEKFGVNTPKQVIDLLGMMGDSVDNIPGIPGIGPKTAQKFIQKYGSLETLLENTHELKGKQKENVENYREQAILSKKLATIITDAPVDFDPERLTIDPPDFERVKEIFAELEFKRLLENLYRTYGIPTDNAEPPKQNTSGVQTSLFDTTEDDNPIEETATTFQNIENTAHFYQTVDSSTGRKLLFDLLAQQTSFCFDCETTSLNALEAELVGISFSMQKGKGYYLALPTDFDETYKILQELKPVLESPEIVKIAHNIKYDTKVLFKYNIQICAPIYDTMIAHYVLQPDMRHGMDTLAESYLKYQPLKIETLIGKKGKNQKSFRTVDLATQTEYAVEDADITFQLKEIFSPKIQELNQNNLLEKMEFPLALVLAEMEKNGIEVDIEMLRNYSEKLGNELAQLEEAITAHAGEAFNINSPKQLGEILFDKLKIISNPKKTRTGQYATSEDILVKLKDKHPLIKEILEYRQIQKLKSTYVDALPQEVNPKTRRVHTQFAQTVAATGRLASSNPNLQNIPIRTERGRKVREAFVPAKGHTLLAADYSQIELRLIAAMSQDPAMVTSFQNGEDIHRATAAKVFGVSQDAVTREQRSQAKTVNFGIIYGVSAFGLSEQTGLSRKEAKELIDAYFETYPTLQTYMKKQIEIAREKGYVETLLGRRRYLKDIHSRNPVVRGHAERNAVNTPIQGSAADIIKMAMIEIHQTIHQTMPELKLLLQVHDELVFEVPEDKVEKAIKTIQPIMENVVKLSVPLVVECGYGKNWLEAH